MLYVFSCTPSAAFARLDGENGGTDFGYLRADSTPAKPETLTAPNWNKPLAPGVGLGHTLTGSKRLSPGTLKKIKNKK